MSEIQEVVITTEVLNDYINRDISRESMYVSATVPYDKLTSLIFSEVKKQLTNNSGKKKQDDSKIDALE
jgi:hypothetical protein